jgi:hypothetical protein
MSEPARLVLVDSAASAAPVPIAAAFDTWDHLPALWRVLLADARPAGTERLGSEGTAIATAATDAVERLTLLLHIVAAHPLLHRIPTLTVYLPAVATFLRQRIATFPRGQRPSLLLMAWRDFDEGLDQAAFDGLAALGATLADIQASGGQWRLDEAFGFSRGRLDFTQWRAWVGRFGLDTLDHPYFRRLEHSMYDESEPVPPDLVRFEDFGRERAGGLWGALTQSVAGLFGRRAEPADAAHDDEPADGEDDEDGAGGHDDHHGSDDSEPQDPWAGSGFRPVRVHDRLGLRFVPAEAVYTHLDMDPGEYVDAAPDRLALAAEWDDLLAGSNTHAWACRDGRWRLVALRRHCELPGDAWVDAVVPVPEWWGTYVVKDGRCGLLCVDTGRWLAEPIYDEMAWAPGVPGPVWRVRLGRHWGLLSTDGDPLHACVFDSLPGYQDGIADYDAHGLHVRRDGRAGWLAHDGTLELACAWDEVRPSAARGLFAVRRDGQWGLAARGDRLWLPCTYAAIEVLAPAAHLQVPDEHWDVGVDYRWPDETPADELAAGADPARANILVAVRTASGMGVVDQANRIVVPPRYAAVAPVQNASWRDSRWLHLTAADGRQGLWSVAGAAEVFACEHRCLEMFTAPGITRPLVGIPDGYHYRLWYVDGTPAHEEAFASLSVDRWEARRTVMDGVGDWNRREITQAWLAGRAVRARLAGPGGKLVALLPGAPPISLAATLERAYWQDGDDDAALALAQDCRRAGELQAAREWSARACVHLARPGAPERVEAEDDDERRQGQERFAERARFFAGLLDEGIGGPREPALALHWVRQAAAAHPIGTPPDTLLLLGKLLLDPAAGAVDRAAAVAALEGIHYPNLEEGEASLLLARCVLADPAGDPAEACALLARANGAGALPAALELAELLERLIPDRGRAEADLLRGEAAYYRAKAAARQAVPAP